MITILADDITGAAEIAGVCLSYGLSVTFDFDFTVQHVPASDVWVIASDTRSLPEEDACDVVRKIACFFKENNITSIFKKIDSALRGHIIAETNVLLEYIPKEKVFILPANPETGRIIQNGKYYIDGQLLNDTSFSHDPDFPAKDADVRKILQMNFHCKSDSNSSGLNDNIIIPDISSQTDYNRYAGKINKNTLPVGGSVFFEACLKEIFQITLKKNILPKALGKNRLMICGSTHENSKKFIRHTTTFKVIEIPVKLLSVPYDSKEYKDWLNTTISIFQKEKQVLLSIEGDKPQQEAAGKTKPFFSETVKRLLQYCSIDELFIEGGATAYSCIKSLGFSSLIPVNEYTRGVVRLRIPEKKNLYITIKPGSYEWPENLFE